VSPIVRDRREVGMTSAVGRWRQWRDDPWLRRLGYCAVTAALIALPFVVDAVLGRAWVRIIDVALLFVLLGLGLNIVVGFAGLLDLGYIAFFAVGAYSYALLASPQFDLHWSFLVLLPLGAFVAGAFGLLLGVVESLATGYIGDLTGGVLGSNYRDVFAFLVLILVLVFRPSGLLGERVADRT